MPGTVDLTWPKAKKITAVRIVSGQSGPKTPISDFVLQYKTADGYKDIPGTETKDNNKADWGKKFDSIETDTVRLKVTKSDGDLIRIWEIEVY